MVVRDQLQSLEANDDLSDESRTDDPSDGMRSDGDIAVDLGLLKFLSQWLWKGFVPPLGSDKD